VYENVYSPVTTLTKLPVKTSGLCKIVFFKWNDVLNWPAIDPLTGIISTVIDLKPGGSFFLVESAEKNRIFSETEKYSDAGPFWDIQVTAQHGANTPNNILSIAAMTFHQFGIIVYDRDGNQRLIGDKDSGAKLIVDYTSGDYFSSRIKKFTWQWKHQLPAPIYSSDAFNIIIDDGGGTIPTGTRTFIMRFRVGDPGAPMTDVDTTLTDARFENKNILVFASGMALPCNDSSGDIDWSTSIERHYLKTISGNTITWVGGVTDKEIIEIYAFS
jgi:hypothetical protein